MNSIAIGIAVVQLLDIILHATTDQLEPIRVTSNLVILVWLGVLVVGKINIRFLPAALAAIGTYLLLNMIFLAGEGIYNLEQGGGPRSTLFLLMFLTITLSALLIYLRNKVTKAQPQNHAAGDRRD
jgi:K+-sensing histidine kinase KdpD